MTTQQIITDAAYLIASVLFILGLRSLTKPETARRGMQLAAIGMVAAVCIPRRAVWGLVRLRSPRMKSTEATRYAVSVMICWVVTPFLRPAAVPSDP